MGEYLFGMGTITDVREMPSWETCCVKALPPAMPNTLEYQLFALSLVGSRVRSLPCAPEASVRETPHGSTGALAGDWQPP
jgi:hypothetical protein